MNLGKKGKDIISGFEGIIIGYCKYLTGCNQYLIRPACCKNDGSMPDAHWLDEDRVEILPGDPLILNVKSRGNDIPAPIK